MIGKQIKGKSFGGLLKYVLSKENAKVVGKNMLGETAQELSAEFAEARKLRPQLEKAVYHASLSLPKGETLSDTKWEDVATNYLNEMGFSGSQFVAVLHQDTEHQHIHIVASRIRLDGSVVSDSHDYRRSEDTIRGIELRHNLSVVERSQSVERRAPTSKELRHSLQTGKPSVKLQLQSLIDQVMSSSSTVTEFINQLNILGIVVDPNVAKNGVVTGISFILDGERMKGSNLGRRYTWKSLTTKGEISYGPDRDNETIRRAGDQATASKSRERIERGKTNSIQQSGRFERVSRAFNRLTRKNLRGRGEADQNPNRYDSEVRRNTAKHIFGFDIGGKEGVGRSSGNQRQDDKSEQSPRSNALKSRRTPFTLEPDVVDKRGQLRDRGASAKVSTPFDLDVAKGKPNKGRGSGPDFGL